MDASTRRAIIGAESRARDKRKVSATIEANPSRAARKILEKGAPK